MVMWRVALCSAVLEGQSRLAPPRSPAPLLLSSTVTHQSPAPSPPERLRLSGIDCLEKDQTFGNSAKPSMPFLDWASWGSVGAGTGALTSGD
jgi:hypothetical protein